ncbi:sigma E regulatory protein, MucB/RseB [Ferrimonas balearica DSM 9799]|uniref:Sigma E regulatory protein, MucB/RseB n=2 Tax=Ferrimonas balearica TaxID=44012 RepID=E1SRW8_FERBD|nr:MucB/RseB C-terminal domain-containing protein [Ferrimonas balearica]ADN74937.1 sigma E regulatory protein, MucB/RseB [Ferrimonas balearica DSM 9799]MBW3140740.1 MucB/RseB C-terminal domain-containing protein [Ferrimonas balearica]MBW3165283.1 MucB/RseB C-terminal domain-containing protein [Ferrimonas balearica]MBY5981506.1 MucB/RseB C-terminal domain-containing protein [Ferrimonas balearica]MBY6107456.1 MucB/RseB C-terminal domain-containing protein [Ferrimonas balearica]
MAANAQEAVSAQAWLERMASALNTQPFQLSFVQLQRDQIRALRYLHGVVDGEEVAYLDHLNGPAKSVVRVGEQVTYLEHDVAPYSVAAARIRGWLPPVFGGQIERLVPHYQFVLAGRNRVAGRTAQLIRVVPNDSFRYQYRVWLDLETALPLRVDLLDTDNNLLEQLLVIELHKFDQPLPALAELKGRKWPDVVLPPHQKDTPRWQFGWLPHGFEMTHYDRHMLLGLNEPVEYLSLSDGLAELSVYIGRVGQVELPTHLTTTNGLALATAIHGDVEVVVVGKMPVDTLSNVANNIYPVQGTEQGGDSD